MSAPTPYDRQNSFALFSAENPSEPHSGTTLDIEFNAVKVSLDETQSNLALIQDDDGQLARGSVGRGQLDSSITIGFASPTPWAQDTSYTAEISTVFHEAIFYSAIETHTSGPTFEPSKWFLVADLSASAAIADGSITEAKLADGAVTANKIATNSVGTSKLSAGSVSTPKLQDSVVTNAKIAAGAVSSDKVDASVWSTGDGRLTLRSSAATAWVMMNDGTIGDALSGASTRANADCQALFTLLFNNISDTYAPLLTSVGGATTRVAQTDAATAWAAHCRISLTKQLGRAIGIAGAGSGLTLRTLGQTTGAETHALTEAEGPEHDHDGVTGSTTSNIEISGAAAPGPSVATTNNTTLNGGSTRLQLSSQAGTGTLNSHPHTHTIPSSGEGDPHNNMQPTSFWNVEIKL